MYDPSFITIILTFSKEGEMQSQNNSEQSVRTYTLAQITAVVAFSLAFIAALGQFVVIFLPDVFSKLVLAPVLSIAVISVVVGLVASRQANREQAAQIEREPSPRSGNTQ